MAERKRAPGASENWKTVAATSTRSLLMVAIDITSGSRLLGRVVSAHGTLFAAVWALRLLREGATRGDIAGAIGGQFGGGSSPSALLDGALAELNRLRALHARAGCAFAYNVVAAARLRREDGDDGPDPSAVASWDRCHSAADARARDAKRRLSSAASTARAAEDAVRVLRSFPRGSPGRTGWTSAALRLALHAAVSAAFAWHALRRMRDAVALEFCVASRIVNSLAPGVPQARLLLA